MLVKIVITLAAALIAMIYMAVSPIGPGVFLAAISPFDALFNGLFGLLGNTVTYLPLLALLMTTSPNHWVSIFFGSRIQLAMFVFILLLSVSHMLLLMEYPEAAIFEYLRKLTVFMVLGIWAWTLRGPEEVWTLNRVLILSTVAYTLISMADFYFGVGALPGADASAGGVLGERLEDTSSVHSLRYRGGGLPINRTANWLLVPTFLAFGWFMLARRGRGKLLALFSTVVCVTGIFATVGRSAIAATVFGFIILLPTAIGLRPTRMVGAVLAGTFVAAFGLLAMAQLGFLDVIQDRFFGQASEGATEDRLAVYRAALAIWMSSPLIGVGDSLVDSHQLSIGVSAHNSFLGILAEAGLLGFVPFVAMIALIFIGFLRPGAGVSPEFDAWRPYFFAGFVASFTQSMFNEYTWERFIWYAVAYLIAHERLVRLARAEEGRRGTAQNSSDEGQWSDPLGDPAPL